MTLAHLPDPEDLPPRFVLLDRILELGEEDTRAVRRFAEAPLWQGVEALAQLAALHQRWRRNFGQQAFLLSVQRLTAETPSACSVFPVAVPAVRPSEVPEPQDAGDGPERPASDALRPGGNCLLDARLLVHTDRAAQYDTMLRSPSGQPLLNVLLHIGVRPFPDSARADAVRRRYMELFPCLRNLPARC